MKKFLLFAAAALIVGSASALPYNKKKATSKVQLSQVKKTAPEASQAPGKLMAKSVIDFSKVRSLDKKTIKSINPVKKFANSRSNRAASLTSNYTGTAINYSSKEQEIWTMSPDVFEDETPCLVNVIPSPFGEGEENSIAVSYTVDGNKIKVPQQYVASVTFTDGDEGFMWAVNIGSSVTDGSLNFTLSDDGSLTYDNYYSSYVVFSTNEVDWNNLMTYVAYTNVKYVKEGVIAAPEVMYEPTGLYLHAFMDRDRQWYGETNYSVIPAYASVGFKNYTTDLADAWSWSVSTAEDTPITETGNDRDFSFNSTGGMAYTPAELVGSNQGVASAPYKWGLVYDCTQGYLFAGEMQSSFGDYMILGRSNPDNSYAYYSFLGTPDVNSENYSIEQLILYQGQPSAPFYFEGISLFVKDFQIKDEANFNLKCKIVKVTRSEDNNLTIGDVIAEADIDTEEIYQNEDGQTTLYWTQFYKEDEEGMSVDVDYLMLDEEFAVIIDGWDNNTFSAIPFGEYEGNAVGSISTFGKDTGDDKIYTYASGNMLMGFVEGIYGYLHTTDNTSVTIPAEGGQAAIHIVPMLYSVDGDTGEPTTRLFLDEVEGNEVPSWLTVGFANEVYTENESSFDLVFQAEASTEARSCTLVFMQEGAKLEVTITQAAGSGGQTDDYTDVTIASIADATAKVDKAKLTITNGKVLYANGARVFVREGSKAALLYALGIDDLKTNATVSGTVKGKIDIYNNLPEFCKTDDTNADGLTITQNDTPAEPLEIDMANASNYVSDLVKFSGVTFTEVSGKNAVANLGSSSIKVFDQFGVFPASLEGTYDMTGIITVYKENLQIYPTEIKGATGISNINTDQLKDAPAYNVAGQRVNKNFKGLVVKDGRKFMNK